MRQPISSSLLTNMWLCITTDTIAIAMLCAAMEMTSFLRGHKELQVRKGSKDNRVHGGIL